MVLNDQSAVRTIIAQLLEILDSALLCSVDGHGTKRAVVMVNTTPPHIDADSIKLEPACRVERDVSNPKPNCGGIVERGCAFRMGCRN